MDEMALKPRMPISSRSPPNPANRKILVWRCDEPCRKFRFDSGADMTYRSRALSVIHRVRNPVVGISESIRLLASGLHLQRRRAARQSHAEWIVPRADPRAEDRLAKSSGRRSQPILQNRQCVHRREKY